MTTAQTVLVYCTTQSPAQARAIAEAMVEQKLAACANILHGMESIYVWEGALQHSNECLLLLKSTQDKVEALCAGIRALHSYTTPCIVTLPITGGDSEFLRWVYAQTHP